MLLSQVFSGCADQGHLFLSAAGLGGTWGHTLETACPHGPREGQVLRRCAGRAQALERGLPIQVVIAAQGAMALPQHTQLLGRGHCTCRRGGILPPHLSDSAFLFVQCFSPGSESPPELSYCGCASGEIAVEEWAVEVLRLSNQTKG